MTRTDHHIKIDLGKDIDIEKLHLKGQCAEPGKMSSEKRSVVHFQYYHTDKGENLLYFFTKGSKLSELQLVRKLVNSI